MVSERAEYEVWGKDGDPKLMVIILSNLNGFTNFFT